MPSAYLTVNEPDLAINMYKKARKSIRCFALVPPLQELSKIRIFTWPSSSKWRVPFGRLRHALKASEW